MQQYFISIWNTTGNHPTRHRILDSVTATRNLSINYNKRLPEGHLDSSVVIKENTDTYLITAKILLQLSSLSAHSSCTQ